LDLFGAP